jgi:hypothetical protein
MNGTLQGTLRTPARDANEQFVHAHKGLAAGVRAALENWQ